MPTNFEARFTRAIVRSNAGTEAPPIVGTAGSDTLAALGELDAPSSLGTRLSGLGRADQLTGGFGNDVLFGGDGNDWLQGGFGIGRDYLLGGNGRDTLFGGLGADTLYGGTGSDVLEGGLGSDLYVLNSTDAGRDRIVQFISGSDQILIELTTLELSSSGLPPGGPVEAEDFVVGPRATTAEQRFIYDPVANTLAFDADGNGAGRARVLASFELSTDLDIDDIAIVSSDFSQFAWLF